MKILTIIGARPQFIKASVVSRQIFEFRKNNYNVMEVIVHTGQHYNENMSEVFFKELDIPKPDYNLGIGSASHGAQTGRMLEKLEDVMINEKPDWVLIYGDTNSTLAGALSASKLGIKTAHVEAGLRSYDRSMPEEINRVVADHLSDVLFCPTDTAVSNLEKEGIVNGDIKAIFNIGDVMYDTILNFLSKAYEKGKKGKLKNILLQNNEILLAKDIFKSKKYYLATVHRAENSDNREKLAEIVEGLNRIGEKLPVIFPIHPRTKKNLGGFNLKFSTNVRVIEPVSYLEMLLLEKNAAVILTDSGGVQKEAFLLKVPSVTLREETEWVETVESGCNILTGADSRRICEAVERATEVVFDNKMSFYGDGKAAFKIVEKLILLNNVLSGV